MHLKLLIWAFLAIISGGLGGLESVVEVEYGPIYYCACWGFFWRFSLSFCVTGYLRSAALEASSSYHVEDPNNAGLVSCRIAVISGHDVFLYVFVGPYPRTLPGTDVTVWTPYEYRETAFSNHAVLCLCRCGGYDT